MQGILYFKRSGKVFEGKTSDIMMKYAKGCMTYIDGTIYWGTFINGLWKGHGKLKLSGTKIFNEKWFDDSNNQECKIKNRIVSLQG